jgi:hypothetical protein
MAKTKKTKDVEKKAEKIEVPNSHLANAIAGNVDGTGKKIKS